MDPTPHRRINQTTKTVANPRYQHLAPIKQKPKFPTWLKLALPTLALMLVAVGAVVYFPSIKKTPDITQTTTNNTQQSSGKITKSNPDFSALVPGKDVSWTHLDSPSGTGFYAYVDSINGVSIRVSEQPLPKDFSADPEGKLAQLAKDYGANRSISSAPTAYIGTSTKGQQSVLLTKNSLLILITSDTTLNDRQWTDYISSLK